MKNEIRALLRKKREDIPPLKRSRNSKKIALNILRNPKLSLGNRLGFYFASKYEVNTKMLINAFLNHGKEVFLPIIEGKEIFFARYDPQRTTMIENRYGIGEPSRLEANMISPSSLDTVFLPILGYNSACYRLGMGGGFYDRSFQNLKEKSPIRIGLAFSFQEVTFEPESHDVPLFGICTEDGVTFRNERK